MFRAGEARKMCVFRRQMVTVSVTSRAGPKLPEITVQCLDIGPCVPKMQWPPNLSAEMLIAETQSCATLGIQTNNNKVFVSKPEAQGMRLWLFTTLTRNTCGDSAGTSVQEANPVHT